MATTLIDTLQTLALKGAIRQIDYQFARFVASQESEAGQEVGFLAGLVSYELSKGNICLVISEPSSPTVENLNTQSRSLEGDSPEEPSIAPHQWAIQLGLYGEAALTLTQQLAKLNWLAVIKNSNMIGVQGESIPMMFDGHRLYLHRYWQYEMGLSKRLVSFGSPMILKPSEIQTLSNLLDVLFQRSYHYLFNALQKGSDNDGTAASLSQVQRQQIVCDHLDVVEDGGLDWSAIDEVLMAASRSVDLTALDSLVPLAVCVNWQKVAAAVALTRRFAVISGGPGTGKTTTVTKLLAALITQAEQVEIVPTIRLVAPTGKAAARLTESIGKAISELSVSPDLKAKIPTQASTIHRLLGAIPNSAEFRHNRSNPLHLDILVIDEASMVDLPMMYKVVDALPDNARLLLLGDKDQLASVEAGSVLGDICSFQQFGYSSEQTQLLQSLTSFDALGAENQATNTSQQRVAINRETYTGQGLGDSLCMLQKSFRFDARSGIGQLAKAINSGQASRVDKVLALEFDDIEMRTLNSEHYNHMLITLVEEYGKYLQQIHVSRSDVTQSQQEQMSRAQVALQQFSLCRLLCAVREGDFGVSGLNYRIERALTTKRLIRPNDELWYPGRPVMVTQNDHGLELYNGDIGICMIDYADENRRLKVFFELPDGSVKSVLPSRVPSHETAYAMTIHKSQGSEFSLTMMILPPDYSPVLTRELIYTGITRAKNRLALYSNLNVLKRGIRVKTERASGLVERLQQLSR
ncbi:exodeoxyribonuclease V subunit alpha [uncultured Vibrio sp.]|uniref:exodeoxyribonuclease V subunit alpha n=1 Tax=uncultured Vibrio sp. TaxID=114054 RepID=UPI000914DEF1|nr:exodeoxyribonuclease V subunit alpha [uncultured Vibrio sp.]OIQ25737.1 MAG: exodeoxyribonuclease V subunit alpha [Vibrio sp. MedPE-SWchi]